jgi:8-oxo-dGTP diphosphatase
MKKGTDYTGITVTFLCHDGAGNYLLHKRSAKCRDEHGRWDGGSGGLKFGETIEDALRREIGEEYLADVLDHEFLGYREVFREHEGKPTHWIAFDFRVRVDRDTVQVGEPEMQEELGWFPLDAFPEPLHSQLPFALEKYRDRL